MNSMTEGLLFYVGNSFKANLKDIYLVFMTSLSNFSKPCPTLLFPRPSDIGYNHMSRPLKRFITPELAVIIYIGGLRP